MSGTYQTGVNDAGIPFRVDNTQGACQSIVIASGLQIKKLYVTDLNKSRRHHKRIQYQ